MTTTQQESLTHGRLSISQIAEALSNIRQSHQQQGMASAKFYQHKRQYETQGLGGFKSATRGKKEHPWKTKADVVDRIVSLCLAHPSWGQERVANQLAIEGVTISGITIYKILGRHGMATKADRLDKLERQTATKLRELSAEQLKQLERINPCYREIRAESHSPGARLAQDSFFLGQFEGIGRVYLHAVVDMYGCYAFGLLHTAKDSAAAAAVLNNDVLPFYRQRGLRVGSVVTDTGHEFCGTEIHPYELFLALAEIEHQPIRVRQQECNGFIEYFHRAVREEFFNVVMRRGLWDSIESLQAELVRWLLYYNTERSHAGYPNMGKCPMDVINSYSAVISESDQTSL